MGFERDSVVVTDLLESPILSCPVDESFVYRGPDDLARVVFDCILAMAVVDAVLRQGVPAAWESVHFAAHDRVARIPVEGEVWRLNRVEGLCGFATGCECCRRTRFR